MSIKPTERIEVNPLTLEEIIGLYNDGWHFYNTNPPANNEDIMFLTLAKAVQG